MGSRCLLVIRVSGCRRLRVRPAGITPFNYADSMGVGPSWTARCCGKLRAMPRVEPWPRTILHVDLDAFYTSVHQRDQDRLRGIPVAVAGSSRRAVVMGASYEARTFGVRSAMPLHEALQVCPQLTVVPGLGPKTEERLRLMGVRTVGDLADYDTARLLQVFGTSGAVLQRLAQGRDREPVDGTRPAKTISAETTFENDVSDRETLETALRDLTDRVTERLVAEGVRARTIYVKLKLPDFRLVSRQVSRTSPTDDVETIFRAARSALDKSHLESRPVRLLGAGLSGLVQPQPDLQMSLFD